MILGTGIDVVDIPQFEEQLERNAFKRKVFTENEISNCESHSNASERFAGKFAAKEALMKAMGKGIRQAVGFTQIEVLNNVAGAPIITATGKAWENLKDQGAAYIHVSISHTSRMAVAVVILEK